MNPAMIFNALNNIQRDEDPEAYEPEIVIQHRKKREIIRQRQEMIYNADKALFDFDDDIDNLSEVEDRYGGVPGQKQ